MENEKVVKVEVYVLVPEDLENDLLVGKMNETNILEVCYTNEEDLDRNEIDLVEGWKNEKAIIERIITEIDEEMDLEGLFEDWSDFTNKEFIVHYFWKVVEKCENVIDWVLVWNKFMKNWRREALIEVY